MGKRVFELARELEMSSKELLVELKRLGVQAANHMVQLDEHSEKLVLERLGKKKVEEPDPGQDPFAGIRPGKRILIKKTKAEPEILVTAEEPWVPTPEVPSTGTHPVEAPLFGISEKQDTAPETHRVAGSVESLSGLSPALLEAHKIFGTTGTRPAEPSSVEPTPSVSPTAPLASGVDQAHPPIQGAPGGATAAQKSETTGMTPVTTLPVTPQKVEAVPAPGLKDKPKKKRPEEEEDGLLGAKKWKNFKAIPKKEKRLKGHLQDRRGKSGQVVEITKPRKKIIKFHEGITVKDFADIIGQKGNEIIAKLMEMGIMSTLNQIMDTDAAVLIAEGIGLKVEMTSDRAEEDAVDTEAPESSEVLLPRSPVVTVMGHVDHGKTSLLDAIRKTRVTEQESGGITQHIGAYTVPVHGRSIVFLDTPGHEAFTAMRARGAKVTDIVVLVVAADDGVMPQTVEAINHAKAARVPILVAINKIDKPDAAPDRIRQDLTKYELVPEEWGGQNIFVHVSAKKQTGLDHLLEMILLQADVLELKANPNKMARGTILEAKLDRGRGPVATVLVQSGTLRAGDPFVCGIHFGKVRLLNNDEGKMVKEAPPSSPVEVIGFSGVPQAGDVFTAVEDEKVARTIASTRMQRQRTVELEKSKKVTLDEIYTQINEGTVRELNLIIKADVQGSAEAVAEALEKLSGAAVKVRVIHQSAGGITETDVMLASASNALIIAFNVRPESKAQALAEREQVDIRHYNIIYDAVANVRDAMEGLLEPTLKEKVMGRAEVREIFPIAKLGTISGCFVTEGVIARSCSGVRVLRDSVVVYQGRISSLRRFKDDVREVQSGYECGIGIENFNDLKQNDVIEAFIIEKVATKLED